MVGVNVGVPVPREPFRFGGWNDSKFGVGDITGRGSIEFWTKAKKITTKWNREAGHQLDGRSEQSLPLTMTAPARPPCRRAITPRARTRTLETGGAGDAASSTAIPAPSCTTASR